MPIAAFLVAQGIGLCLETGRTEASTLLSSFTVRRSDLLKHVIAYKFIGVFNDSLLIIFETKKRIFTNSIFKI